MKFAIIRKKLLTKTFLAKGLAFVLAYGSLFGCANAPQLETVEQLELQRFMGDWHVLGHIPTFLEADAYNAVETYTLNDDRTVDVQFRFNEGALAGPVKNYDAKAYVDKNQQGLWDVQFLWPFTADYRVAYIDSEYQYTIVARKARDYVWIMGRSPQVSEPVMLDLIQKVRDLGYDLKDFRRVPHDADPTESPSSSS